MKWDRIVPAQCQPNPSILRLSKELMWVTGQEPLHADIDFTKTNGVGPGMPFANGLLTQDPGLGVVGLVPCAIGGTAISQWEKGGELYGELIKRSEAAVAIGGGRIRALLWYQGESDTNNREDADEYKERLETFFYHVREDLQLPSLPIIQVWIIESNRRSNFQFLFPLGDRSIVGPTRQIHCSGQFFFLMILLVDGCVLRLK
ncbi:Probable carbohydrate esterase At4g34215 [Linum perenne]